jgi:hypothetical protein
MQHKFNIDEIRLRHFRAFENAVLHLSDLTVLVGPNGSGKTTLMEAMDFIGDALNDSLLNALDRRGGLKSIRQRYTQKPFDVSLAVVMTLEGTKFLYGFRIGANKSNEESTLEVKEEILFSDHAKMPFFIRKENQFDVSKPLLKVAVDPQSLALPIMASQDSKFFYLWRELCSMRTYNPSPEMIRQEWPIGDRAYLMRDGRNAADILKHVQDNLNCKHWLVSHLAEITSGITNVYSQTTDTGRRGISKIFTVRDTIIADLHPPESVGRLLRSNSLWRSESAQTITDSEFFKI